MDMYVPGLVSVITPTYKRSDMLTRAIDSILNQSYPQLEMLVVDDNMAGDEYALRIRELMSAYRDEPRVRLIEQPKHINGAAARNAGIRAARGEYICFLDDDDYYTPDKLEVQVAALSKLPPEYGMVSCLVKLYNGDKLVGASVPYKDGDMLFSVLTRKVGLGTGSLLIRRAALDDAGYFDESLVRHQDLQLFACLTAKYKNRLVRRYLHCIDAEDGQNRKSSPEKMAEIKKAYFQSIAPIMDSLTPRKRKIVYIMHDFEQAFGYIKIGRTGEGLKLALHVLKDPYAVYLAAHRSVVRLKSRKLKEHYLKKYN